MAQYTRHFVSTIYMLFAHYTMTWPKQRKTLTKNFIHSKFAIKKLSIKHRKSLARLDKIVVYILLITFDSNRLKKEMKIDIFS